MVEASFGSLLPSCNVILALLVEGLVFWLILRGLTRNSVKLGLPTFAALGKGEASLEEFDAEVESWLPLLPEVDLPLLIGADLAGVARRKTATAGSLDGWGWRELKTLPIPWFDGLATILTKVQE